MSIRTRLAAAERAINEGGELIVIWVNGGFSPSNHDHATAGDMTFNRGDDETPLAFRERCEQAAREMGASCLVFGGLPERNWSN